MQQSKARLWLAEYRGNHTHQEVADMSKLSRSFYTEIENGDKNPSVDTAKRIARALRFKWTKFFEEQSRKTQPTGTTG